MAAMHSRALRMFVKREKQEHHPSQFRHPWRVGPRSPKITLAQLQSSETKLEGQRNENDSPSFTLSGYLITDIQI